MELIQETSWHSYPSIYALGHRVLANLFQGEVTMEEKVDGSQFSMGRFGGELRARSKGQQLVIDAPEKMFTKAVDVAKELDLRDGWTYRGEYLRSPKHNALAYSRHPKNHIILFDINPGYEQYLPYEEKAKEADRLGLEVVPLIAKKHFTEIGDLLSMLDRESILGGTKIEGIVIKNYSQFGQDKKVLMGKYVSEAFKEVHGEEWKKSNPTKSDIIQGLILGLKTEARWLKAVQHLQESGNFDGSPKDIGNLIKEIQSDIVKECEDDIKEALYKHAISHIKRGVVSGVPEWYKQWLLQQSVMEVTDAS